MDALLSQLLGYVVIILVAFILMWWLQRGFFFQFLKARSSRGKKILCKVRGKTRDYYILGVPEGDVLKVTFQDGFERLLKFDSNSFYNMIGLLCCDIDESSGAIINRDFNVVTTYDHPTFSNLLKRALMSPNQTQDLLIKIILVVVILVFFGLILIYFKVQGVENLVSTIGSSGVEGITNIIK
jgi:hypothetical protein